MTDTTVPAKDQQTADWLTSLGVPFDYVPDFELGAISEKMSLQNQARLEPLNEETVDQYASAYRLPGSLDKFPALIVRKMPRAYVTLSGNHRRTGASRAGKKKHSAFVIKCADEVALRITYEDNMRNGLPPTRDERVRQAIHMMEAVEMSQSDAARMFGLTQTTISKALQSIASQRRAADLKLSSSSFQALSAATQSELQRIQSDPVFYETAKLAMFAEPTIKATGMKAVINAVLAARSEASALKVVAAEMERLIPDIQKNAGRTNRTRGRGGERRSAVSSLVNYLVQINQIRPSQVQGAIMNQAQAKNVRKELDATISHLQSIRKAV